MNAFTKLSLFTCGLLFASCGGELPAGNNNVAQENNGQNSNNNNNNNNPNTTPNEKDLMEENGWECIRSEHCPDGFSCDNHTCHENGKLFIKQTALPAAKAENYYYTQLEAGFGTAPYEWLVNGTLPAGLSYTPAGLISGTPTIESIGSYPLKITVFDSAGQQTSLFLELEVVEPGIYITTKELPQGKVEEPYEFQLEADFGSVPYQWRLNDGTLPAGLVLNDDGTISGTPLETGTFSFTVKVFDSADPINTAVSHFDLYIKPLPLAIQSGIKTFSLNDLNIDIPQLDSINLPNYSITLLMPIFSNAYVADLQAVGGEEPYTWSIANDSLITLALSAFLKISTALPEGLTMDENGHISGTTTEEPSAITIPNTEFSLKGYFFIATVTDAAGESVSGIFCIPVIDFSDIFALLGDLPIFGN